MVSSGLTGTGSAFSLPKMPLISAPSAAASEILTALPFGSAENTLSPELGSADELGLGLLLPQPPSINTVALARINTYLYFIVILL